jgi:hypothetical protein
VNIVIRKTILMLALGMLVCLPGMASADLISTGDPMEIGSWAQRFQENGVGTYDTMEFFIVSGATDFEAPGANNFSSSGWTGTVINPDYARATGSDKTDMQFDVRWTSAQSVPFRMDFLAWDGSILKEAVHADWSGGGWSFTGFALTQDYQDANFSRVPLPPTALLMGVGLLGMVGLGWRRRTS